MAVTLQKTAEEFAELVRVTMEGTTSINAMLIPAGTLVEGCLVVVKTAATGTAMNLSVGDTDTAAGYIAAVDAQSAAGTVIGDDPTERGSYGYDGTKKGSFWKYYAADKYLTVVGSAAGTGGVMDVIIWGRKVDPTQ